MFILRKTSKNPKAPLEFNLSLGESYNLVHKEASEEFNILSDGYPSTGELYGFVVYNQGADVFPLYLNFNYYIMASDGKTFSNITSK